MAQAVKSETLTFFRGGSPLRSLSSRSASSSFLFSSSSLLLAASKHERRCDSTSRREISDRLACASLFSNSPTRPRKRSLTSSSSATRVFNLLFSPIKLSSVGGCGSNCRSLIDVVEPGDGWPSEFNAGNVFGLPWSG
jgi:hypothetical protein